MIKNIREKLYAVTAMISANLILAKNVMGADGDVGNADGVGGVTVVDPESFGEKITQLVTDIGMPIGGGILFLSVVIIAIKLMITSSNAQKRTQVMEGFMYMGIGGAVLGGALFVAGLVLGLGQSLNQ